MSEPDELGELFRTAREYGLVRLSTMDDGLYYCTIEFNCPGSTKLSCSSTFKNPTPEDAIRMAIKEAEKTVDYFLKKNNNVLQSLKEKTK